MTPTRGATRTTVIVAVSTPTLALGLLPPPPPPGQLLSTQAPDAVGAADASTESDSFILDVPYRSQYNSSPYQNSNCGPVALAMVLEAYGLDVPTDQLRALANQLQGTSGYNDGIALDYLQAIARQAGLTTDGLSGSDGHYRHWNMADVIRQVRHGYPVITLVHFASLPEHAGSPSTSDHYLVIVGLTHNGFVVNDPASDGSGNHQVLTPGQLLTAWRASSIPQQGVAFLPALRTSGPRRIVFQQARTAPPSAANAPAPVSEASVGPATSHLPLSSNASVPSNQPTPLTVSQGLASAAWTRRVSAWQHAATVPITAPIARLTGDSTSSLVLAERHIANPPLAPSLIVVALVGLIAVAIVKTPRATDLD